MASNQATRAIWIEHLRRLEESGMDRQAYCREHGLKDHQLRYWIGRLKGKRQATKRKAFVRAIVDDRVSPHQEASAVARLVLPCGGAIEFSTHVDPTWIGRLAREVGR